MEKFLLKLPSFNSVGAGSTANVLVPKGPTYRKILFLYKESGSVVSETNMKAHIDRIRLKINGTSMIDVSCKHLLDLHKFRAGTIDSGIIPVELSQRFLDTSIARDNLAWGTKNVETFGIELDINSSATAPTIEAYAVVTPEKRDLGAIIKTLEYGHSTSTTGEFEISSLPKTNGQLVGLHFDNSNITNLEVTIDQIKMVDTVPSILNQVYKHRGERVPQTGYVHLEQTFENLVGDAWSLANAQDFRVKPTLSTAGSVPIVMETLAAPLGLAS